MVEAIPLQHAEGMLPRSFWRAPCNETCTGSSGRGCFHQRTCGTEYCSVPASLGHHMQGHALHVIQSGCLRGASAPPLRHCKSMRMFLQYMALSFGSQVLRITILLSFWKHGFNPRYSPVWHHLGCFAMGLHHLQGHALHVTQSRPP